MLYPRNAEERLDERLFKNPTREYRGTPFWAWDGKLSKEELRRQILGFKEMGMGGFYMHVRTGMDTPYLTDEFMDYIRFCIGVAKEEDMLAWLYDEDRWPSGTAGGKVTDGKKENARKHLTMTSEVQAARNSSKETEAGAQTGEDRELLAVYDICLDEKGSLISARRIEEDDPAEGVKWYAYMEYEPPSPWFNDHRYADVLREEAVEDFIRNTHEVYYRGVGEDFGGTVPAIFTDEPHFSLKRTLAFSVGSRKVNYVWTDRFPQMYRSLYGEDLLDRLPELFWELPDGKLSDARWRFMDMACNQYVENYCRRIGDWCRDNGLCLNGHINGEQTLTSQTQGMGDAMRCYRAFGIPGFDMLCDFHEYNTAKQAQSVMRQVGSEALLSEMYGVTGWDYDFRGYKLQGDWQAALGVTARVMHLAWMTMKGEAKRDYPATINYQSPWWDQYSMVENHFARLNTALSRGKAKVRVAVVHPVESFWMHWGPEDRTAAVRGQKEKQFAELPEILLFGGIDFDYLCEAELPVLCEAGGNPLKVGQMAYDAVIVPPLTTIRSTTIERLNAFRQAGGTLLFIGDCPRYVDAFRSEAARELYESAGHIAFDASDILDSLEAFRLIDIRRMDGVRENRLLYQMREDGAGMWLFLCNGKNPASPDVDDAGRLRFTVRGEYRLTHYDTMTGEIRPVPAVYRNGNTILEREWYIHESMLLYLTPGRGEEATAGCEAAKKTEKPEIIFGDVDVVLEEPNMLLIDMAEYSLNGGKFRAEEELLKVDRIIRTELGIPVRRKEVVQPYLLKEEAVTNFLTLRYRFESEPVLSGVKLALEEPSQAKIELNGVPVSVEEDGWFVDRAIRTVALPDVKAGENVLLITVPFGRRTNLEAFYLLGDFGVEVIGTKKIIRPPVRRLGFGDITRQRLPFYTGNLKYCFRVQSQGDFDIRIPQYRGGLVKVFVDGRDAGNVAFSPYRLHVRAEAGEHEVEIRLYGTRYNGFGQLHHTQGVYFYMDANSWRSEGDLWCYEYQFKPAGILKSPELTGAHAVK